MKVLIEKPPVYNEAIKQFKLGENPRVVFAYGDVCYNPADIKMSPDLIRHEETHLEQQGHDRAAASIWWQRYFADENFRLEQEIEAYGEQYKFICQTKHDRNIQAKYLYEIASALSGQMYGKIIGHTQASKRVREYASGKDIEKIEDHIKDESTEL